MDYRDVLSAAEYPQATRRWGRIDRMTAAEVQALYDADWRQYEEWFRRQILRCVPSWNGSPQ